LISPALSVSFTTKGFAYFRIAGSPYTNPPSNFTGDLRNAFTNSCHAKTNLAVLGTDNKIRLNKRMAFFI